MVMVMVHFHQAAALARGSEYKEESFFVLKKTLLWEYDSSIEILLT